MIEFTDRVAIVTGAGAGLGRAHALALAARGARVVVNDLGGARDGTGGSLAAADAVVAEIQANGGQALANGANVANLDEVQAMVDQTLEAYGRVDVLINNAGILRDKTFAKMSMDDFQSVVDVHLMGSANCSKAVWPTMCEKGYGRIVMTTSSSGLYGNFGQSNYGAAKMAVVGLMSTLALEGYKYDIRVNAISPVAATRMTEDIIPDQKWLDLLKPEAVSAAVLTLCDEECPTRAILCAGGGGYALSQIVETEGVFLQTNQQTPEEVRAAMQQICDLANSQALQNGGEQTQKFLRKAGVLA